MLRTNHVVVMYFVAHRRSPLLRANLRSWFWKICCCIIELNFTTSWLFKGGRLVGEELSNSISKTSCCCPQRSTAILRPNLVSEPMKQPPYASPLVQIFVPSWVGPHARWIALILASFVIQLFVPVGQSGRELRNWCLNQDFGQKYIFGPWGLK